VVVTLHSAVGQQKRRQGTALNFSINTMMNDDGLLEDISIDENHAIQFVNFGKIFV
jgi:hypothetical protein